MLISLSYVTTRQISIWGNDITFWEYIVDKAPPSGDPLAHINLGDAYLASRLVEKALEQYQAALRLKPGYVAAYNGLGNVSLLENRFDLAMKYYEAVLRVKPDLAETHFNLGFIYLKKGSLDMARTEFELGLKIKPDDDKARRILNSIN
jgi:tetratricopeptide (TPR) repeat protein